MLCASKDAFGWRGAARAGLSSVTEAARALGVSRKTLSAILNGRAGISPEMAVRLSLAFDTSAESWLNQQTQYDLWKAERHRSELDVKKLSAA
ncbi:MAG: HigA family addiction module antitoxin [Acidobacteriota bacterium]